MSAPRRAERLRQPGASDHVDQRPVRGNCAPRRTRRRHTSWAGRPPTGPYAGTDRSGWPAARAGREAWHGADVDLRARRGPGIAFPGCGPRLVADRLQVGRSGRTGASRHPGWFVPAEATTPMSLASCRAAVISASLSLQTNRCSASSGTAGRGCSSVSRRPSRAGWRSRPEPAAPSVFHIRSSSRRRSRRHFVDARVTSRRLRLVSASPLVLV
jgi:hypothetical protein